MEHYKSWLGLNKWLNECLCEELKDRITYFLTRYHKVHDSYGRAAILLDGKEMVCFSWIEQNRQEQAVSAKYAENRSKGWFALYDEMKPTWDETCTYCEWDFLKAVLEFRNLSIQDALNSDDYIIKILAFLDKRVGKRTLQKIADSEEYKQYPMWARQFYELRLGMKGDNYNGKWILSRHKKRDTWETQGGHIEAGETPLEAAKRELFEESGIRDADVYPVCDYWGFNPFRCSNGMVFLAVVHSIGELPESEMQEIGLFEELPENLTYPQTSPVLYREAEKLLKSLVSNP